MHSPLPRSPPGSAPTSSGAYRDSPPPFRPAAFTADALHGVQFVAFLATLNTNTSPTSTNAQICSFMPRTNPPSVVDNTTTFVALGRHGNRQSAPPTQLPRRTEGEYLLHKNQPNIHFIQIFHGHKNQLLSHNK